jgi:hypothetical protein
MRKTLLTIIILGTFGCAGETVLMRNAQTGDVQKCEVSARDTMTGGKLVANLTLRSCRKQWEKLGYQVVN